jgi:hypothetical protein
MKRKKKKVKPVKAWGLETPRGRLVRWATQSRANACFAGGLDRRVVRVEIRKVER